MSTMPDLFNYNNAVQYRPINKNVFYQIIDPADGRLWIGRQVLPAGLFIKNEKMSRVFAVELQSKFKEYGNKSSADYR